MKLKAKDTLHITAVKSDNILPNEEFEVSDAEGKRLVAAGLATEVKSAAKPAAKPAAKKPVAKKAAAPKNKMKAAPANKAR